MEAAGIFGEQRAAVEKGKVRGRGKRGRAAGMTSRI